MPEELKKRINKLGGLVISDLLDTTAAIVTTKKELINMSNILKEAMFKDIEVIEENFFDFIDATNGSLTDSINLIKEKNIASWGSDPFNRISKNNSNDESLFKNKGTEITKIKDGMNVDPGSGLGNISHVYKEQNKYYSVILSKADIDDNRNSFYKLQLLEADNQDTYWVFRSWGRTGTSVGGKMLETFPSITEAMIQFKSIYMKKTKYGSFSGHHFVKMPKAYVPLDINYEDIRISKINIESNSNLPQSVQQLIVKIFDTEVIKNCLLQYELDLEKMPLGKLSKEQIKFGYEILSRLLEDFDKNVCNKDQIKDASNKFYTIVPHNFGIKNPPLLDSRELIIKKIKMLDSLLDIEIVYNLLDSPIDEFLSPIESFYQKLNTDIKPLDKGTHSYDLIANYIQNTNNDSYNYEIEEIFEVCRFGEIDRYSKFKNLHNRRLLWHGSRVTNLAGILSQGLRIAPPEAPVTGYMFGKGIYFADMISKSIRYCLVNKNNPIGLVLLCEVALGNVLECYEAQYITKLPNNIHSVWGVGCTQPDPTQNITLDDGVVVPLGVPMRNNCRGKLLFNEHIVYDVAQRGFRVATRSTVKEGQFKTDFDGNRWTRPTP
ncbi:poly [ADP-ribose] polymerase-like [Battus philenor]|uniref:poly [ADP-ribose] polymerase-like n=1 Tax=Battus philenor TaxID=42288 RepID=UPI0035D08110